MSFSNLIKSVKDKKDNGEVIEAIAGIIAKDPNSVYGIRTLCPDEHYKVGSKPRKSYDWDYENDCSTYETTKEKLNGTCATSIPGDTPGDIATALLRQMGYGPGQKALLRSEKAEQGYDPGEIIMPDATVMYLFD